jgi:polyhydroxybutyrate depolymerase
MALCLILLAGCEKTPEQSASTKPYDYPSTATSCRSYQAVLQADTRLTSENGIEVLVRTPANYRPDIAHPLLVVYAPAGMSPTSAERFTGFTPIATSAGYIVAYPQHIRPSLAAIRKLATVPALVSAKFCIDQSQIFLTGHSDGGTATTAIAVQSGTNAIAALAPSAAGFTHQDLGSFTCPSPRPVMVWHGARDRLFPGWGREAAAWWARCNQCDPALPRLAASECTQYQQCVQPVTYCEHAGGHTLWPNNQALAIMEFFGTARAHPPIHSRAAP